MIPPDVAPDAADDAFARLLAVYDEAMKRGETATDPSADPTTPPDLRHRLERAQACLRRLHRVRPAAVTRPPDSAADAWPGEPRRIGRFRVDRLLGSGGFGLVYLAVDEITGREVALKLARPEVVANAKARARVITEARHAARLSHKNLAALHEVGELGPALYLVMEYCPGVTLAEWLRLQGRPPEPAAVAQLLAELAAAVGYMNRVGIVHRDLKPANVILSAPRGTPEAGPTPAEGVPLASFVPKVIDFGLAKDLEQSYGLTRTGARVGTTLYMAPEQVKGGAGGVGPRTDIWSLGVILYELLTGRHPFSGESDGDVVSNIVECDPVRPRRLRPGLPRGLEWVCLMCLEKSPRRRYPSASELADDLERWLRGEPVVAGARAWVRRLRPSARRLRQLVIGLAVVIATGLVGGVPAYRWYSDPLNRMQRALDRGERVALVGASGLPSWYRWHGGRADLELVDDGSEVASFRATQLSFLELCPNPRCDRFRLTAEVRHLESPTGDGRVGVFVGYTGGGADSDFRVDRCYGTEYSDLLIRGQTRPKERYLNGVDYAAVTMPDGTCKPVPQSVWATRYTAPDNQHHLPPWRTITLEVTPNEVRSEWARDGAPAQKLPTFSAAADLDRRTEQHQGYLQSIFPRLQVPAGGWSPRGAVGVYAKQAWVAFRRVTVEPMK